MVRREKSNYIIRSVSHALDVIEQFFGDADELGVTELSKRLKLHKNNIFRLLATLESRGYIEQNKATENYRLGLRSLHLGQAYVSRMGLLRQARPVMEALVKQVRESAYVAVARTGGMVPLDGLEADQPVRLVSTIGETLPLHATAVGKTHLAFASEDEARSRLPETLKRFTTKTVTERAALAATAEGRHRERLRRRHRRAHRGRPRRRGSHQGLYGSRGRCARDQRTRVSTHRRAHAERVRSAGRKGRSGSLRASRPSPVSPEAHPAAFRSLTSFARAA